MPKGNDSMTRAALRPWPVGGRGLLLAACGKEQGGPPPPPEVSVITLQPRADLDHRSAAGPHHRVPRRRSAPAGHGHRAEAPVRRRRRSEGGRSSCSRSMRAAIAPRSTPPQAALKRAEAQAVTAQAARGALRAADRRQRGVQAGERRRHRRACARRGRRRRGARRRSTPRASTWCTRRCCRRSPGASAARWSPKARWSPPSSRAPLATVQQLDPIYVDITQSSTEMLRLQRQLASGELVKDDDNQAEVGAHARRRHACTPSAAASRCPKCRWTRARARWCCARCSRIRSASCCPACSCARSSTQGTRSAALLVPQRGVSRNQKGEATVLVVDQDDKVAERVVTADRAINGEWLITAGSRTPATASSSTACRRPSPGSPVKPVPAAGAGCRRRATAGRCGHAKSPSARPRARRMLSRFFIDRPIFAWVIAHHHHARGRARGLQPAGRASTRPSRRRTIGINVNYPGASAQTRAGHGDAGHRAAAERHRQPRLHQRPRATPTARPRSR